MIDSGNIKDCLYSDTDYTEWYVDKYGDLRATPFITTEQTIIYTVYSKTVLPICRLKICKIKIYNGKSYKSRHHTSYQKGSAMTLPGYMAFLFQSKDNQTNKRGDENGLQSIDRSRA